MAWLFRQALWERPQSHLLKQAGSREAQSRLRVVFPSLALCRNRRWSSTGMTARGPEMKGPKLRCQSPLPVRLAQN